MKNIFYDIYHHINIKKIKVEKIKVEKIKVEKIKVEKSKKINLYIYENSLIMVYLFNYKIIYCFYSFNL